MQWQTLFKEAVQDYFDQKLLTNPKYSKRKLGTDLGLSIGAVSSFFSDRYPLSSERAAEILKKLNLPARRRDYLLTLMGEPLERKFDDVSISSEPSVLNWIVQAVLHFHDLDQFECSIQNMATRLGVKEEKIIEAKNLLLQKNFLILQPDGSIKKRDQFYLFGDGPSAEAVRESHLENLNLNREAFLKVDKTRREFFYTTFTADESCLEKARAIMHTAQEKVLSIMDGTSERTQVYRFTTTLFPMDFENTSI